MKNKLTFIIILLSSIISSALISYFVTTGYTSTYLEEAEHKAQMSDLRQNRFFTSSSALPSTETYNFIAAAEKTVHAVVHVKTSYQQQPREDIFEFFFGFRNFGTPQPVEGTGSGVILSQDGYIVTNNHVIAKAQNITITLNDKRSFSAKLIGTDPSTDLALLKIDAENLPYLEIGNSDDLRLGEWVLAVGNPLNLTSTVTAGIVSSKARNINILSDKFKIESFIQTDAAVNPGNSGGALVNTAGQLVGINTAIASQTGAYSGYSFAVPSSIVQKVTRDLKEFGVVQRAFLGIELSELTSKLADSLKIKDLKGVYTVRVVPQGAAEIAGIKDGDIILKVNDVEINTVSQLQEQISRYRPNDQVTLLINREGKTKQINVILRNKQGTTDIVKITDNKPSSQLSAKFEELSNNERRRYGLRYGIKVTEVQPGKLKEQGVRVGYIIVRANRQPVKTVEDLETILSQTRDEALFLEGIYPNGSAAAYGIILNN